jgi:hypothetical protein
VYLKDADAAVIVFDINSNLTIIKTSTHLPTFNIGEKKLMDTRNEMAIYLFWEISASWRLRGALKAMSLSRK